MHELQLSRSQLPPVGDRCVGGNDQRPDRSEGVEACLHETCHTPSSSLRDPGHPLNPLHVLKDTLRTSAVTRVQDTIDVPLSTPENESLTFYSTSTVHPFNESRPSTDKKQFVSLRSGSFSILICYRL